MSRTILGIQIFGVDSTNFFISLSFVLPLFKYPSVSGEFWALYAEMTAVKKLSLVCHPHECVFLLFKTCRVPNQAFSKLKKKVLPPAVYSVLTPYPN